MWKRINNNLNSNNKINNHKIITSRIKTTNRISNSKIISSKNSITTISSSNKFSNRITTAEIMVTNKLKAINLCHFPIQVTTNSNHNFKLHNSNSNFLYSKIHSNSSNYSSQILLISSSSFRTFKLSFQWQWDHTQLQLIQVGKDSYHHQLVHSSKT